MNRLRALVVEQDRVAVLLTGASTGPSRGADLDAPVAACPPWRVRDLAEHLGRVHRWAAAVTRLPADGEPPAEDEDRFAPDPRLDPAAAYRAAAAVLREALAGPPDRPCPTLAGPGVLADWTRRQLHETFVHRLDLQEALGRTAAGSGADEGSAEEDVAADCVAEVVEVLHPRQVRLARTPPPVVSVDLAGRWVLGRGPVVARVDGRALDLARLLWRRTDLDAGGLTATGDVVAARTLLGAALTP